MDYRHSDNPVPFANFHQHRDETLLTKLELTECCHGVLHVAQDSKGLRTLLVESVQGNRPLRRGQMVTRIDELIEELTALRRRLTGMSYEESYRRTDKEE